MNVVFVTGESRKKSTRSYTYVHIFGEYNFGLFTQLTHLLVLT